MVFMRMDFAMIDFVRRFSRRHVFPSLALVACLSLLAACARDVRYAKSDAAPDATPAASTEQQQRDTQSQLPRTNLPMPPVASSHASSGWTLLDGRRQSLADYRGKVLVLDLYATYCGPCRDEIPHLNDIQRRFEKEGLHVVGLNVGGMEDRRKVPGFVADLGIVYNLGNPDWEFIDALSAGETAIPRTYIFDRQGRLVDYSVGYSPAIAEQIEGWIQTALATKVTGSGE